MCMCVCRGIQLLETFCCESIQRCSKHHESCAASFIECWANCSIMNTYMYVTRLIHCHPIALCIDWLRLRPFPCLVHWELLAGLYLGVTCDSCIGVHEMHGFATILLAHDPLSSLTYPKPLELAAGNLPIKILVARWRPTNDIVHSPPRRIYNLCKRDHTPSHVCPIRLPVHFGMSVISLLELVLTSLIPFAGWGRFGCSY